MRLEFEYGHGTMEAQLPDSTDIFIPGETVKDPDYIPEDKLEEAYLNSLADPIVIYSFPAGIFPGPIDHTGSYATITIE